VSFDVARRDWRALHATTTFQLVIPQSVAAYR